MKINFNELAKYLEEGKEVEFTYNNIFNVITVQDEDWCFISDFNVYKLAPKNERKWLVTFLKGVKVADKTVEEIFDNYLYDVNSLRIS